MRSGLQHRVQDSSVELRMLSYLDEYFCMSSPVTRCRGTCSTDHSRDHPHPISGNGSWERSMWRRRRRRKTCWESVPKPSPLEGGVSAPASAARRAAALAAPTGLCNGTPHNAEQKAPRGQINFKLDVKRWQLYMSRVGRKHRGFHFHARGTICLPNSTDSFWGSSFRWQMVIKLLFTLAIDSS